jgi:hypothetical protein
VIYKKCLFCADCVKNYPEDIGLSLYPVEMTACPRCLLVAHVEVESEVLPRYKGAPAVVKKPKALF